jgi:hypothetical protein
LKLKEQVSRKVEIKRIENERKHNETYSYKPSVIKVDYSDLKVIFLLIINFLIYIE